MPDVTLNDISLHYEVDGTGPPLILLGGMLSDSATWTPLLPLLTSDFTVIRPDNRTTGRTTPWDAPTSVAHMAQDAAALMDHLGHGKFHAAGHSMGGLISLEMTALAPDRIATASVLASGRARTPRTMAVFDALLAVRRAPKGEETWLRSLYPWVFGQAFFENPLNVETALTAAMAYPYAQTAEAMALQMDALRGFRPQSKLDEIACPVQVLYAQDDLLVPPAQSKPSFASIPDLTEATIEGAGHSIIWDAPAAVADHLRRFLQRHPLE